MCTVHVTVVYPPVEELCSGTTHCSFIFCTVSDTFSRASSFQISSGFSWEPARKHEKNCDKQANVSLSKCKCEAAHKMSGVKENGKTAQIATAIPFSS